VRVIATRGHATTTGWAASAWLVAETRQPAHALKRRVVAIAITTGDHVGCRKRSSAMLVWAHAGRPAVPIPRLLVPGDSDSAARRQVGRGQRG
jgi:hypothetical protein